MPQTPIVLLSGRHLHRAVAANTADCRRRLNSPQIRRCCPAHTWPLPRRSTSTLPEKNTLRRLPTIQGVVVVWDAKTGGPLAVMDSVTRIGIRAAATTVLAAQYDARKASVREAIIGCGAQGK